MDKSVLYVNKYFPMPNPLRVWIEMTWYPRWTGQQVTELLLQAWYCQAEGIHQGTRSSAARKKLRKDKKVPRMQQYKPFSITVERRHREGRGHV